MAEKNDIQITVWDEGENETFKELWTGPLSQFLRDNEDSVTPEEIQQIKQGEIVEFGGGAAPYLRVQKVTESQEKYMKQKLNENVSLTPDQIKSLEQEHNVYIDADTEQFTKGEREDTYGWNPIPKEWLDSIKESQRSGATQTIVERRKASKARMEKAHKETKTKTLKEQTISELGPNQVMIDSEVFTIEEVSLRENGLIDVETESDTNFIFALDSETAGKAAKENWQQMDQDEIIEMIGKDVLVSWALGNRAGPGTDQSATSFNEWLDIVAEHPAEEFAYYDGLEQDIDGFGSEMTLVTPEIEKILQACTVAYRYN